MSKRVLAIVVGLLTIGFVGVVPAAAVAPDAPTGVVGSNPTDTTIDVDWLAPGDDGGETIESYTVTSDPADFSGTTADGVTTSIVATGLDPATSYTFTVVATNVDGDSVDSAASAAVETLDVPGPPTGVVGSNPTTTSIEVNWTAPADNGGSAITDYIVTSFPASPSSPKTVPTGTSTVMNGLDPDTAYTFRVRAVNEVGNSAQSAASASVSTLAVATEPDAPTGVVGSNPTDTTIDVDWVAPGDDGGETITSYTVTSNPADFSGTTADGGTTSIVATGLDPATSYTFTVLATNVVGDGPASAASAAVETLGLAPGLPTGVVGSNPTTTSIEVNWTAPADNGGSAITDYIVTSFPASPSSPKIVPTGTSTVMAGLDPGTEYTFRVQARNALGDSAQSVASAAVSTQQEPQTFTPSVSPLTGSSIELDWTASAGSPTPTYTVTVAPTGPALSGSGLSRTVTGMTPGVEYTFTITASNGIGDDFVRTIKATSDAKPAAPTAVTATVIFDPVRVVLSFTPPANTGTAITTYTITPRVDGADLDSIDLEPGDLTVDGSRLTYTIPSTFDRGDYVFKVNATNEAGTGATGTSGAVSVPTSPGATSIEAINVTRLADGSFSGLPYGNFVTITWEPPEDTSGLPITKYSVSMAGLSQDVPAAVRTATIGPLAPGSYFAEIQAFTDAGAGPIAVSNQVEVRAFPPFVDRTAFITRQYLDFLGRSPDQGGLDFWLARTDVSGANAPYIVASFMDSNEFAPRRSVVRLYEAYFQRDPDAGGFDFWSRRLASGDATLETVSQSFAASPEFIATYGALTDDAFIRLVYRNVLQRAPDSEGLAFWTGRLAAGLNRGTMMTQFSESPEFIGQTDAHVNVVVTYRGLLDRLPEPGGYTFWVGRIQGDPNARLSLISNFLVSEEYAERATG